MKRLIFLLFPICFAVKLSAQTGNIDTALKFDKYLLACEKQWVVKQKPDTASSYKFGYVYIDGSEGFIFQEVGQLSIRKRNKYQLVPGYKKVEREPIHTHGSQFLYGSTNAPPMVALLSSSHFKELKIENAPTWVMSYYSYTDTVEHNYRSGCICFDESLFAEAEAYFKKVYEKAPHYGGVKYRKNFYGYFDNMGIEFMLSGLYLEGDKPDKAIPVLDKAILNAPNNVDLYRLLGLAYDKKKQWNKAIEIYKYALTLITVDKSFQKASLAGCISNMYGELKNKEEQIKWRSLSDAYDPHPGRVF
ncbi:MAG: tetratricopeptide repeat protein [Mucilaginibacter sp.]|nr:tetratricopeptide repeat protein [Mucilaginibacter sp.]